MDHKLLNRTATKKAVLLATGYWRVLLGLCPACNSDAPKMYICQICGGSRPENPKHISRYLWWVRFKRCLRLGRSMVQSNRERGYE